MAYQLSQLITNVQDKLDDPSFSTTSITQFINDTQHQIFNSTRFRFMEKATNPLTTIGNQVVTNGIPTDSQDIIDVRIISPTGFARTLPYLQYEDFDKYYPQPTLSAQNPPILWYLFAGLMYVYPIPDQAYTLEVRYIRKPGDLLNPTDVPDIPAEFQEIITLGAYRRCLEKNNDNDIAQIMDQQYTSQLQNMLDRFSQNTLSQPAQIKTGRSLRINTNPRVF